MQVNVQLLATITKKIYMGVTVEPVLLPNGEIDKAATILKAQQEAEGFAEEHNWDADQASEYITEQDEDYDLEDYDDEDDEETADGVYNMEAESEDFIATFDKNYALENTDW